MILILVSEGGVFCLVELLQADFSTEYVDVCESVVRQWADGKLIPKVTLRQEVSLVVS